MLRERGTGRCCREIVAGEGMTEVKVRRAGRGSEVKFCRTVTKARVTAAIPEIVDCFVEQAKKGSIAHVKALTAMGGMDAALSREDITLSPEGRPRQSLAGYLMNELKRQQKEQREGQEPR